jgi:hypothetical protein
MVGPQKDKEENRAGSPPVESTDIGDASLPLL